MINKKCDNNFGNRFGNLINNKFSNKFGNLISKKFDKLSLNQKKQNVYVLKYKGKKRIEVC